jgi:hypothetical protein
VRVDETHPFGEDDHIKKEKAEGQIDRFYINDKNLNFFPGF